MGHTNRNQSSNNYRVEANKRTVDSVMNGEVTLAIYAKVLNRLGEGRMRIYYEHNKRGQEGIAKIRGLLRKKGQVPIQTNDVVIITPREFESGKDASKHFDIIGVLTSKQVSDLKKHKAIPDYFLNDVASTNFDKKEVVDAFEFDYEAQDEDVDIDAI
uniref:S1-like domain-containing protein n=1 Tax=viral metagenome TaxID=1070528 RepID=A0A6C0D5Y1_9ZZZZ